MAPRITCECGDCQKCHRREYMRAWYRKGNNAAKQRASQIASRARRIEAVRAYDRERGYRVYDQAKVDARKAVHVALMRGSLERQPCEKCGERKTDAHHADYTQPLDVVWLCRACHGEVHRKVA